MGPLGALLIGATVLVRVDLAEDVPLKAAHAIATELAASVEARTGHPTVVETRPTGRCADDESACIAEVRARTGVNHVIILRLYRGVSAIAVFAKIAGGKSFETELASSSVQAGDERLRQLVADMFAWTPSPVRTGTTSISRFAEPVDAESQPLVPIVVVGSGVALGAAAIGLLLKSNGRLSAIEDRIALSTIDVDDQPTIIGLQYAEVQDEYDGVNTERTTALALGIASGAALISGLIWWILFD